MKYWSLYICYLIGVSFVTFCLYGIDKKKAKKQKIRVSEKCLLSIGIFGGALGALIGMKTFNHKTRHLYFWLINLFFLFIQIVLLFLLIKFL